MLSRSEVRLLRSQRIVCRIRAEVYHLPSEMLNQSSLDVLRPAACSSRSLGKEPF